MNVVWPPLSNEKLPWTLKEEVATKKQILEQAEMIKGLQHQLEEARQTMKGEEVESKEEGKQQESDVVM